MLQKLLSLLLMKTKFQEKIKIRTKISNSNRHNKQMIFLRCSRIFLIIINNNLDVIEVEVAVEVVLEEETPSSKLLVNG